MGINQGQCEAHGGSSDQHGQNMGFRPWEGEKIEPVHVPIAYIYIHRYLHRLQMWSKTVDLPDVGG